MLVQVPLTILSRLVQTDRVINFSQKQIQQGLKKIVMKKNTKRNPNEYNREISRYYHPLLFKSAAKNCPRKPIPRMNIRPFWVFDFTLSDLLWYRLHLTYSWKEAGWVDKLRSNRRSTAGIRPLTAPNCSCIPGVSFTRGPLWVWAIAGGLVPLLALASNVTHPVSQT